MSQLASLSPECLELSEWACQQLNIAANSMTISTVSGDASFRKYYRLNYAESSYILVDAPPASQKNKEFVDIAQRLFAAGIKVPEVLAVDYDQGYLLLSDLGDQLLMPLLNAESASALYGQAMQLLLGMNQIKSDDLDPYDEQFLLFEMSLFSQWFVADLLCYEVSSQEQALIDQCFKRLVQVALSQPQGFVHRDFHSRNIMQVGDALALIDFQDAVQGPITYDLVSLLRDCYIAWPQAQIDHWVQDYYVQLSDSGLYDHSAEEFKRDFDFMGLQRHIKVLGIFARLSLRDGKDAYLQDLPLVIAYVRHVFAAYQEFEDVLSWVDAQLMPVIRQQAWYRDVPLG